MTFKRFCFRLYSFIASIFTALFCCFKKAVPEVAPVVEEKKEFDDHKKCYDTPKVVRTESPSQQKKIRFKPLFLLPEHFNYEAKNDLDYKKAVAAKKKADRMRAKAEMLAKMSPEKPKPKPRTPSPTSDS